MFDRILIYLYLSSLMWEKKVGDEERDWGEERKRAKEIVWEKEREREK